MLNLYKNKKNYVFAFSIFWVAAPMLEYDNSLKSRQEVKENTSLILMVNIRGNPTPDVTWSRDDGTMLTRDTKHVTIEGDGTFSR